MKALNIVLSILILVLALASAVFSYFLFEKRDMLVKGWDKMAVTINKASAELDNHSDTKIASQLTASELSHEKYAEIDAKLQKLVSQSRQIIAERDDLADALRRIGAAVEVPNLGSEEAFRSVASYNTNRNAVVRGVSDAVERRDDVYRALAAAAREVGASLDTKSLIREGSPALSPLARSFRQIRERRGVYESNLRLIGTQVNVRNGNFSESGYRAAAQAASRGVTQIRRDFDAKTAELDNIRRSLIELRAELKKRDIQIDGLNGKIADNLYTIKSYKSALGVPENEEPPVPWRPGSPEVLEKTVGEVVKVNGDYGYIAVNLGKKSVVKQPLGTKTLEVNPMIRKGMEMVVARGKLNDKAAFVARITLDEIGDECSTANIPAGGNSIKVGDIVYFDRTQK